MTKDELINIVILSLARPDKEQHDPFLAAKTSFAIAAVDALIDAGQLKETP